ncbi:MAG: transglutaminaseTgpA domain-containing protein [Bacillota bacterium]
MVTGGTAAGTHRMREADFARADAESVLRYLDAGANLLHCLLILMMYHSLTEFMGLTRSPAAWAAALALALLTALLVAYWSEVRLASLTLFLTSPLWVALILRRWPESADRVLQFLGRWGHFLAEAYRGTLAGVPPDAGYFTVALVLAVSACWGWTCVRRNAGGLAALPTLGALLFQWFFFFDAAQRYLPLYLFIAGFTVVTLHYRRWIRPRQLAVIRRFSLTSIWFSTAIMLLLVITASAILPPQAPTWSLSAIRQWFTSTFPVFDRVRGEARTGTGAARWFSLNLSGYGPATALGGPLQLDPSPAFSLTLQVQFGTMDDLTFPLYLKGRTLTHYTGRGWLPGEDEKWEWFEPGARFPRLVPTNLKSQQLVQEITPVNLQTNTLFGAGDIRLVRLPDPALNPSHTGGEVAAKSNFGDVIAYNILRRDQTYVTLSQLPYWNIDPQTPAVDPEAPELFLALPDEVPARVHELAREIVDGIEGNYQKAQAVRDYVRNLPYSLEVSAVPAGREFTDHFLFDQVQGYCTYHSTAMAVMLRAAGVPTRWVQGFLISHEDLQETGDDRRLLTGIIPLASAHAWVEVWIADECGWVPFEPTPAFPPIDHTIASPPDSPAPDYAPPADEVDPAEPWLPAYPEDEMDFFDDGFYRDRPAGRSWWQILTLSLAIASLLLLAASAALLFLVRRRDVHLAARALQSALGTDAMLESPAGQLVKAAILSAIHLSRGFGLSTRGMTPREFVSSVADRSEEAASRLSRIMEAYEQLTYAGQSIPRATAEEAATMADEILRILRKELGFRQYFTRIYLSHPGGLRELMASLL